MGFLKLFTKRLSDKSKTNSNSKSGQNTTATITAEFPGQGTQPRSGNAINISDTFPRSRSSSRISRTQLSLDTASTSDQIAPSPAVPLIRDESLERPRTAPNGNGISPNSAFGSGSVRLKKGGIRGAPPVSFRMLKPSTATPTQRPASQGAAASPTDILHSGGPPSRSNSIRSDGGRGFKDILDAQFEIKPPDFRSRVKAAGARDYGEDVADRNIAVNGFDLESPQVQAYYRSNTPFRHDDDPFTQRGTKIGGSASCVRTNSLNSSSFHPPPKTSTIRAPPPVSFQLPDGSPFINSKSASIDDLKRRRSLNTYMTPSSIPVPDSSHERLGIRPTPPSTDSPILFGLPPAEERPSSRSGRIPRDSVLLAKKRAGLATTAEYHNDLTATTNKRSISLQTSSLSNRDSAASYTSSTHPRARHSLHTLQSSISSSISRDTATTLVHATPLAYPRGKPRYTNKQQQEEDLVLAECPSPATPTAAETDGFSARPQEDHPADSAASPCFKGHFTIRETIETADIYSASSSHYRRPATAKSLTNQTSDPLSQATSEQSVSHENSPIRNRSVRAWSGSSATPTAASDASSNPFHRPPSRQTADTSVAGGPTSIKTGSNSSLIDHGVNGTKYPPPGSGPGWLPLQSSPASNDEITPKSVNFNIDDYISSDEESFTTCQHRRASIDGGEEGLLFNNTGYGIDGTQLPGLMDPMPSANEPLDQRRRKLSAGSESFMLASASSSPKRTAMYFNDPSFGKGGHNGSGNAGNRYRPQRYILDTAADDETEDETDFRGGGSLSGYEVDDDGSTKNNRRGTKKLSAILGSREQQLLHKQLQPPPLRQLHSTTTAARAAIINSNGGSKNNTSNNNSTNGNAGGVASTIEEEKEEGKVTDIRAAIKLRKEDKARKRAAKGQGAREEIARRRKAGAAMRKAGFPVVDVQEKDGDNSSSTGNNNTSNGLGGRRGGGGERGHVNGSGGRKGGVITATATVATVVPSAASKKTT